MAIEAVGLGLAVLPLAETAKDLYQSIQRLRLNPERRNNLTGRVDELVKILGTASDTSSAAEELVRSSVQEVKATLESLAKNRKICCCPTFVSGCIAAYRDADKLDEVEGKMESLTGQVVVVESIFLLKTQVSIVFNERMKSPESTVGLARANHVLDFLQRSTSEQFRVVGIHGQPGIGKTTLLNHVWNEVSSIAPFAVRAHIQIGHDATTSEICSLQSIIVEQLGGGRYKFTSTDSGSQKLFEHLQRLRLDSKPVFLAIDNVFQVDGHLAKLLPDKLSEDILPASSVIAITCRDFAIVRGLLNICHLDEKNESRVFCFSPPCLKPAESKAVFAACGGLSSVANKELLESLVPLCDGLPLAITVLGKLFAGNARRSREEWELIEEQMQRLVRDGRETRPVTNALQLSYDGLSESLKAAFFDVVNLFYGWSWERVERIMGGSVLKDLKDSSLISGADHWSKCNQRAIKVGFDMDAQLSKHIMDVERKVVTMHDLVLKFGEGLGSPSVATVAHFRSMGDLLQNLEAPKLRDLIWSRDFGAPDSELQLLEMTENLRTLLVRERGNTSLIASSYTSVKASRGGPSKLRFLRLEGCKSSKFIMKLLKLSSEIREIHLYRCEDVEQLPDTSLHQLEWLSICVCRNFQGFSASCVERWSKLKYLQVMGCNKMQDLPTTIGRARSLQTLELTECESLGELPDGVGELMSLTKLNLSGCTRLKQLPPTIGNALSLQTLDLSKCTILVQLPDGVGELTALAELQALECRGLIRLPSTIGNAASIRTLNLMGCHNLVELPDAMGKLTALTELDVSACWSLKELPATIGNASSLQTLDATGRSSLQGLPPAIGDASSLQKLDLSGCTSMVELPDEVGKLKALTTLRVSNCRRLKGIPLAIGNASSLQMLDLSGCESLEMLPDGVGELMLLKSLLLHRCESLTGLPSAIGNALSLQILELSACTSLVELPDEVGKLTALEKLDVSGCIILKGLPRAIGNASSLQTLDLRGCQSLVQLPEEVGDLTALTNLLANRCRRLQELPSAIGNAMSLERLEVSECTSLKELPKAIGNASSLQTLNLSGCTNLKGLPQAIGNASCLQTLDLSGCESLVELPDEVAMLTALKRLELTGCKSLKEVQPAIRNMPSLKRLDLSRFRAQRLPPAIGSLI